MPWATHAHSPVRFLPPPPLCLSLGGEKSCDLKHTPRGFSSHDFVCKQDTQDPWQLDYKCVFIRVLQGCLQLPLYFSHAE